MAGSLTKIYKTDDGATVKTFGTYWAGIKVDKTDGTLQFNPSGTFKTVVTTDGASAMAGHLTFTPDNTYDIGASGANRPKDYYGAGNVRTEGNFIITGVNNSFLVNTRGGFLMTADGVMLVKNNAGNDFSRLQFGGTSSSFPSLKRNAAGIDVRLADDSGYTALNSGVISISSTTSTPAGGSSGVRLTFGSTTGFGVYVGSGVPTVSAGKGSLYLRSDGSTTNDRAYINTDGGTTWTAVTTVA